MQNFSFTFRKLISFFMRNTNESSHLTYVEIRMIIVEIFSSDLRRQMCISLGRSPTGVPANVIVAVDNFKKLLT